MSRTIYHEWVNVTRTGVVCNDATLDFRGRVDLAKKHRLIRTGYIPAFNTLNGVASVGASTEYPPSGGGDWRALYRLNWGSYTTESLIVSWYYGVQRRDIIEVGWDGLIYVRAGDGVLPWGTNSVIDPIVWVELEAVGAGADESCAA